MLEKILIFILFLGPLVFFHELGHFLFARLFGVRVEVFSIGFGPKLLKLKKGATQYALSLIPLGGYVKMFGDDPLNKEQIPLSERKYSFTYKGKWARFWIVMGGPLANFVLAFFLFFALLMTGERLPEMRLGIVPESSVLYERGLRPGDTLKGVNGREITNPSDIVIEGQGDIETVTARRGGEKQQVSINMKGEDFFEEFTKYPPLLRKPLVLDKAGDIYAVSLSDDGVNWDRSLDEMSYYGEERKVYLYPVPKLDTKEGRKHPSYDPTPAKSFTVSLTTRSAFIQDLSEKGLRTLDLQVQEVAAKSAAFDAGIERGDVILSLNGESVYSFETLRKRLQETPEGAVDLTLWRGGEQKKVKLTPKVQERDGEKVKLIGIYSNGQYVSLNFVKTEPKGLFTSITTSFSRTIETMAKTLEGFVRLITGEISFKTIGGPIAIGKVASDSFNTSISYFFQLMALISVNLGVINLFPIPVLDGGHVMFIFFELVNRGPLSRRKMEIAQQIGLSLLLMLMVGAIFNDFSRFF